MVTLQKSPLPRTGLYLVRRGQTIGQISEYFGLPEHIVIFRNKLQGEVKEGEALFLPVISACEYRAEVGDTIEGICRRFSVSREQFDELNGIEYLWPRMRVLLPAESNNSK